MIHRALIITLTLAITLITHALEPETLQKINQFVNNHYPTLDSLYKHLHANPELSFQEQQTAAHLAEQLRQLGYHVTPNIGGHGVVAILENGQGPTLMLRADMDALPVLEETGLPYASQARAIDDEGREVPVMHACGHDVHMTTLIGTAATLAHLKDQWNGTLLLNLQPAEERGAGAKAMLEDGLYTRFPRPQAAIALHVDASLPAGKLGYTPGFAMANVDSVDITIRGRGGHGAYPHLAKDPVVLAADIIMTLQTIISRETSPIDPAVITVGSIHGGTKHNVISSQVDLQLTIRSYADQTRDDLLDAIQRVAHNTARAHGIPEQNLPIVEIKDEYTPALYNDPGLVQHTLPIFQQIVGPENIIQQQPVMGGEDFGRYGREHPQIPIFMFRLGAVNPQTYNQAQQPGAPPLPSIHSSQFQPDPKPTITTGVTALTAAALNQLNNPYTPAE